MSYRLPYKLTQQDLAEVDESITTSRRTRMGTERKLSTSISATPSQMDYAIQTAIKAGLGPNLVRRIPQPEKER